MKKFLLSLSLLAIAGGAYAYDAPVAGTAAAPNYYVIKANRGIPYLAYGRSEQAEARSFLSRTSELSAANIWEITPGSADGTVTIKSYNNAAYLLDFVDADEEPTLKANATAVTVLDPTNIYLVESNGAYAININSAEGAAYPDNCISLDAPGGTVDYCGNYIPTNPASGEGSAFWFYKVDLTNGVDAGIAGVKKAIEDEANAAALEAAKQAFAAQVELYLNSFKTYAENVPQVAEYINAGIAQLEVLEFSEDYAEKISQIWGSTFAQANEAIKTVLNGNEYAIKNLRRANLDTCTEGAYLTVGEAKYVGATSYVSENSVFTFTSTADGGYTIYNAATKTWIGASAAPVSTEAEAQAFYPVINSFKAYAGLMLRNGANSDQGLNWQSWNDGVVSIYDAADEGSVWSLVDYDANAAVNEMAATYETTYNAYIASVPAVKEIFEKAIADIKALTLNAELESQAAAINTKALEDANALLLTCYDGEVVNLKNLRQDMFLEITSEGGFARQADGSLASAAFTMKAAEGGYILYNAASETYVGIDGEYNTDNYATGTNAMAVVADEGGAVTVTPMLGNHSGFYGVVLSLGEAGESKIALNMNGQENLWYYNPNDGGSIWGITGYSATSIEAVKAETKVIEGIYDLQGRKLAAPVKGINIINGKKVLVK